MRDNSEHWLFGSMPWLAVRLKSTSQPATTTEHSMTSDPSVGGDANGTTADDYMQLSINVTQFVADNATNSTQVDDEFQFYYFYKVSARVRECNNHATIAQLLCNPRPPNPRSCTTSGSLCDATR